MFVSDNPALIGYGYGNTGILVKDNTLAGQTTFKTRVDGAVNEIFLLVRNFLQEILTFFDVDMAGGTCTHTSAVVVEMHIIFLRNFQHRHVLKVAGNRFRRNIGILKFESYSGHKSGKDRLL